MTTPPRSHTHAQAPICLKPLRPGKRIFFCSDLHLESSSGEREQRVLRWLDSIENEAAALFLVGDIFDFWCEYAHVVPKALLRFQARLLRFVEQGIPVHLFVGNHDLWLSGYFEKELGVHLHRQARSVIVADTRFFVAHGDTCMSNGWIKKTLRGIYGHGLCKKVFTWLHPDLSIPLVRALSSRLKKHVLPAFKQKTNTALVSFCLAQHQTDPHDGYIFGHTHLPQLLQLQTGSAFLNLGDWVDNNTYAVFDGKRFALKRFDKPVSVVAASGTLREVLRPTPRALASVP